MLAPGAIVLLTIGPMVVGEGPTLVPGLLVICVTDGAETFVMFTVHLVHD